MSERQDVWRLPVSLTAQDVVNKMYESPEFAFQMLGYIETRHPAVFADGCKYKGGTNMDRVLWLREAADALEQKEGEGDD